MTRLTVKTLPSATQRKLDRCATAINTAKKKGLQALFEIGKQLKVAHDALANYGDGTWIEWCQKSCGINRSTAHRYMSVVEQFNEKKLLDCCTDQQTFTSSSLYYLAREATSEDTRQTAMKLAAKGQRITLAIAKQIDGAEEREAQTVAIKVVRQPKSSGWDADVSTATMRTEILGWWKACPLKKRKAMIKTLRDMAAKLENQTKRRGRQRTYTVR